jgi:hypothetical protein
MTEKDELDLLLNQWQDVPALDPQLKHRVWTRIAGGESLPSSSWLDTLLTALSRPLATGLFIAASIVFGVLLAQLQVSQEKQARTEQLAISYMELIDSQQSLTVTEVSQ